jgi:cytidine deaminase
MDLNIKTETNIKSILNNFILKRSFKNDHNGHKYIGCVIFNKKNIYSYGYNIYNTDSRKRSIHAEHNAINKLKKTDKRKKINVLIFRIDRSYKKVMTCVPCERCKKRLKEDIKKKGYLLNNIYCTSNDNDNLRIIKYKKSDL